MKENNVLNNHRKRLRAEGVIKSALLGAAVGFGLNLPVALLYWLTKLGSPIAGIAAGVLAGIAAGILFYYFKYRPNNADVARRIDREGLEERMITMLELEGDSSYIASLQRKDAGEKASTVPAERIRMNISGRSIAVTAAILLFSLVLTALGILASIGKIPYGKDLLLPKTDEVKVTYSAGEGGSILGQTSQTLKVGESSLPVFAMADDGYIFIRWDDGSESPARHEQIVSKNLTFTAVFEKIDEDSDPDDEKDEASDTPVGSREEEEGSGSSDEEGGDTPEDGGEGSGSAQWIDKNQFIDGKTYYKDYLDFYYQLAMEMFGSAANMPQDLLDYFETYFSGL